MIQEGEKEVSVMKKFIAIVLSLVLAFSAAVSVSAVSIGETKNHPVVGAESMFAEFDPTTLTDLFVDFDMTVLFAGFDLGNLLTVFDLSSFLKGLNISSILNNLFAGFTRVGADEAALAQLGHFDLSSAQSLSDLPALNLPEIDTAKGIPVVGFALNCAAQTLDLLFGGKDDNKAE